MSNIKSVVNNTITYPMPNTRETRAGAKACHKAMQDIERIMGNGANTRPEYEKNVMTQSRKCLKLQNQAYLLLWWGLLLPLQNISVWR